MVEDISLARGEAFADAETVSAKEYLVRKDGRVYAGSHVLVDFWGASNLTEPELIEATLREAAEACGAMVLHAHVHEFLSNGGVSGVAVLAESHISIHTWPELDFAAFDIFMCGNCAPERALPVLRRVFQPDRERVDEHKRGLIE
jgi:S-adenosylmethionine decarboxylase